ncbi:MAG: response regulator transcription factor [Thermoanaerobaculia bacterium]|nr:response regulator transcription factor [Thermoanaerobaculia bacterium]
MEREALRVGLIEDDRAIRKGLRQLIDGTPGYRCLGDWMSAEAALADSTVGPLDVLLVDVNLPGRSGAEALPDLKVRFPTSVVVMHTVFDDDDRLFEAICNGAMGYLLKGIRPARLLQAIQEAADGGAPLSPSIARRLMKVFRRPVRRTEHATSLTPRELELLALLSEGQSYQSAGTKLQISINTVRNHVRSIYDKLHVHSKSAAVSKAIRSGLI